MTVTINNSQALSRRAIGLAWFTISYNVLEGIVSVAAGAVAGAVSLVGFGLDSGIEVASAVVVLMRLTVELRNSEPDERKEKRALRFIAITFFALAAYLVTDGVVNLVTGERPDISIVGLIVTAASVVIMPLLAVAKRRTGRALGSRLVLADAAETQLCALLSVSTFVGLVLFAWLGWSWVDAVAGFVIAIFAINEGREAWEGELVEDE